MWLASFFRAYSNDFLLAIKIEDCSLVWFHSYRLQENKVRKTKYRNHTVKI